MARKERKVVTVVFADLVGFTARAERLDPEDVEAILAPYHSHLREELERHGGRVEKFIGDAVMAVFGAPSAHEDDPERALRAALAIREWVLEEDDLEVRIAINTGEALVNLDARPEEGEAMVAGDIVNTASRMQSSAPVSGIVVGETTRRTTEGVVEYRELPPIEPRGKADPLRLWEALRPRLRFGVDVVHSSAAPLVGRERELALMTEALERAHAEREPQLVTLIGVPGIGKSRLVYELMQIARADPERIRWRQGRCIPYGDGVTLWALGEIVKSQAEIFETDEAGRAEEKLARTVAKTLGDSPERDWVEAHLRPLVGLAGEASPIDDREREAFSAWIRFFEALAEDAPLVLVIEDLHWADDELLDFVDELVDRAREVPLLVVATARPELLERRPGWSGGKANALTLSLSSLGDDDIARLLGVLLSRRMLPATTQQAVLARVEGNPLFAEQYARMLREHGAGEEIPLPESVQGIIAARLDALSPREKALVQDASVHGKVFWLGAVAAVGQAGDDVADVLRSLERKEFLRRQLRTSVAGETEYAFRHVLLRDVAYAQIPRANRVEKHRRAADWLESLTEDRDDHVELLADHLVRGLELARAARQETEDLERRARLALREAGARADRLNAFAAAARFYAQALELWPEANDERAELLFELGRARWLAEATGEGELRAALEAFAAARRAENAAEAAIVLAEGEWERARSVEVHALLERALGLVEPLGPSRVKAQTLGQAARFAMLEGNDEAAIRRGRQAIEVADAVGAEEIKANALNTVGTARVNRGDSHGVSEVEESVEILRRRNSPDIVRCLNNLAVVIGRANEPKRVRDIYAEAERAAERFGLVAQTRFLGTQRAWRHFIEGNWDDALRRADDFLAEVEAGAAHYLEASHRDLRASIRLSRGDLEGGLTDTAMAIDVSRQLADPTARYATLWVRAWTLVAAGREDEARELAEELFEYATRDDVYSPFAGSAEGIATMARLLGPERVRQILRGSSRPDPTVEAAERFLAGDYVGAAEIYERAEVRTAAALCRLEAARTAVAAGRPADANEQVAQALAFYRSVGATYYVREAEALLAATA